jgi:hypothetical protein
MSVSNPENIFKYKFKCPDGKNEVKIETIEYKNGEKIGNTNQISGSIRFQ